MVTYVHRGIHKHVWISASFDFPNDQMKIHLKPLFVHVEVDDIKMNKVFINGGTSVILM